MQIKNSRKKQRHTERKFVFRENNFYQLIDSSVTVYFAVNFQTKAENESHCVSSSLPSVSIVLSLLCLNSDVLRDVIELFFGETIGDVFGVVFQSATLSIGQ